MSISFQTVSDVVLGTGGKSKARGCVLSLDHAEQKEVNPGKENPGSQSNTIINKPGDRESQHRSLRTTAGTGRVSHFLQDNG